MVAPSTAPEADPAVRRFGRSLVLMAKAVVLYPPTNSILRNSAEDTVAALRAVFASRPELHLTLTKENLFDEGTAVLADSASNKNLLYELYRRRLADIRIQPDTSASDLLALLSVLKDAPEELEASGGVEGRLQQQGVTAIVVKEPALTVFGDPSAAAAEEVSRRLLDEMLTSATEGSPGSRQAVVYNLLKPNVLTEYLAETVAEHGRRGVAEAGGRFAQVARVAGASEQQERGELIDALWGAVQEMPPQARAELLVEEVLPEAGRDDTVASAVRSADIQWLCRTLAEGVASSEVSREGLARALRSIAQITDIDPDEFERLLRGEMDTAGVGSGYVAETLSLAMPGNPVVAQGSLDVRGDAPATAILALLDFVPSLQTPIGASEDSEFEELAAEARVGITDGDVALNLVALIGLDRRPEAFDSTMAVLEDSLDVLLERGEIDIAAEATDALDALSGDPTLTEAQQERLKAAVGRLAKPSGIRELAQALKFHAEGSAEREAAERLIDSLGNAALGPMLDHLAEEPDMAIRKSLVEALSRVAAKQVEEVGAYVQDYRWYVVRNVVSILGATRSPAALPYLARTLRHVEPRVRREAIRALSGIPAEGAHEALVMALADSDAQNVQIAARYLGAAGDHAAVPALSAVARGEGRGNRENGPRKEAIEALGKIGGATALGVLRQIASKRSLLAGGKLRELREAAEVSLARAERQGGRA